jgi:glycosyltransferase involved in cell wall biosynthesis
MNPYFSVIISVYNKEHFISHTLNSVINQTFKDFEIIIVNDGSTDQSLEVIKQFKDSRIQLIDQQNHGASHARNQGIAHAKGEFIALLDGDDLWQTQFLEVIANAIENNSEESIFTTAIAHKYDEKIVPVQYNFELSKTTQILDFFKSSKKHPVLSGSSAVFRKSILAITGHFDETIISGQDTDLWIRFGIHYPVVFINEVLVHYVYSSSSLSNTTLNIKDKSKFDNYKEEEKQNLNLKEFLERNRFSLAILSKLNKDKNSYSFYRNALSIEGLSLKRKMLLNSPRWLLKLILKLKSLNGQKTYFQS